MKQSKEIISKSSRLFGWADSRAWQPSSVHFFETHSNRILIDFDIIMNNSLGILLFEVQKESLSEFILGGSTLFEFMDSNIGLVKSKKFSTIELMRGNQDLIDIYPNNIKTVYLSDVSCRSRKKLQSYVKQQFIKYSDSSRIDPRTATISDFSDKSFHL